MEEQLTESAGPARTVTITLDRRALAVGLAILATIGAMALGVWVGRRVFSPSASSPTVAAPGQTPLQAMPRVQAPARPNEFGTSSPLSTSRASSGSTGVSVDLGTAGGPSIGEVAPDFSLENLKGERMSLSDLQGHPILINFWATWCPPCRFEMPALEAAYRKYRDQGFVVVAVDVQEPRGVVNSYVKKLGLTIPIVLDRKGQVATDYRVRAYPTSVFVNRKGEITQIHRGMLTAQMIERYLSEILPEG